MNWPPNWLSNLFTLANSHYQRDNKTKLSCNSSSICQTLGCWKKFFVYFPTTKNHHDFLLKVAAALCLVILHVQEFMEMPSFPQCIHGDVAARNVFIDKNNKVAKLGDFGLARDISDRGIYNKTSNVSVGKQPRLLSITQWNYTSLLSSAGENRGRMKPNWFWFRIRMIQYGHCEYLNKESQIVFFFSKNRIGFFQ